jgi:hypothetical protein
MAAMNCTSCGSAIYAQWWKESKQGFECQRCGTLNGAIQASSPPTPTPTNPAPEGQVAPTADDAIRAYAASQLGAGVLPSDVTKALREAGHDGALVDSVVGPILASRAAALTAAGWRGVIFGGTVLSAAVIGVLWLSAQGRAGYGNAATYLIFGAFVIGGSLLVRGLGKLRAGSNRD